MTTKKLLSFLLAVIMVIGLVPGTAFAAETSAWDGTADTAWYGDGSATAFTIDTAAEFAGFMSLVRGGNDFSGKTVTLGADINLNSQKWNKINEWGKEFNGTFDGSGHTVSNLRIEDTSVKYSGMGLFWNVGTTGVVKNLTVTGAVNVIAGTNAAIVGTNYGVVDNCHNYADVTYGGTSWSPSVGGVVGSNYGTVINCSNFGTITGGLSGGIVGWNRTTVVNCYNAGAVTGTRSGGIVGFVSDSLSNVKIENCYNIGTISDGKNGESGGIVGALDSPGVANCYWLESSATNGSASNGDSVTNSDSFDSLTYTVSYNGEEVSLEMALNNYIENSRDTSLLSWTVVTGKTPELVAPKTYVAQIGETRYETFDEAMKAAYSVNGDVTITVLKDASFTLGTMDLFGMPMMCTTNFTVNLNEHKLDITGYMPVIYGDTMTIVGAGTLEFADGAAIRTQDNESALTIKNVTVISNSNSTALQTTGDDFLTMDNCTVTNNGTGSLISAGYSSTVVNLQGGSYTGDILKVKNNPTITKSEGLNLAAPEGYYWGDDNKLVEGHTTHAADIAWTSDKINHWKKCIVSDCDEQINVEAHTFEWVIDKEATKAETGLKHEECAVCEYTRNTNTVIDKLPSTTPSTSTSTGGGFSGVYNYPVNAGTVDGAKVTFSDNNAVAGETVTITVTPDAGKQVDEVIVTDAKGNVITVSKVGDNKYSFTMPAGKVNVTVSTEAIDYDNKIVLQIGSQNVVVDGKASRNDVAPVIQGDRTLVPIRVIVEALGGEVDWNEATRTVTITIDGKVLKLVIDQPIPGFGQGATIMNNRTYVPIRYVAEYVGANVEWIAETQQIVILK